MASLTPRQRLIVTLHYLNDWTAQEIADGMGVSLHAIENCNSRALRALRADVTTATRAVLVSYRVRGE
jgi:DNA-directed RNA polymerase specialized sigma24 family protein